MSYTIHAVPELQGERHPIEVPTPPSGCPLCGDAVGVASSKKGRQAMVVINCRCGLMLVSDFSSIYYDCDRDTFRDMCVALIEKWNTRAQQ